MKKSELKSQFYIFGNRGSVWSNQCHIAESGKFNGVTLCGVPMLSSNYAHIQGVEEIGCPKCLKIYKIIKVN